MAGKHHACSSHPSSSLSMCASLEGHGIVTSFLLGWDWASINHFDWTQIFLEKGRANPVYLFFLDKMEKIKEKDTCALCRGIWSVWLLLPWNEVKIKFHLSSCKENKGQRINLEISCQWSLPSITSSAIEPAPKTSAISIQFLPLLKLFEKITWKILFPPAITFSVIETWFFERGNYLLKENRSRAHPDCQYKHQWQHSLWVRATPFRDHF